MNFNTALAALLGASLYLFATGTQVSGRFTAQPFSQAVLLAHMLAGVVAVPLLLIALALHPVRGADVPFVRRWLGRLVGLACTLGGLGAAATGLRLPWSGNLSTTPDVAMLHCRLATAYLAALGVHVVLSWVLRHRLAGARRIEALREASVLALAAALGTASAAALAPRRAEYIPVPPDYKKIGAEPRTVFTPGRQQTTHGGFIPVAALSGSLSCGASGCHTQIVDEWKSSMHRHAARNDHYRAQVKLRIHDVPVKPHAGARFCAACHEPIAVLSGEVDPKGRGIEFPENLEEGISCVSCHRMVGVRDITGNAAYVIAPPRPYTGQGAGGVAGWLARAAIRARPAAHRDEMMRPLLRDSEACSPCHTLNVGPGINPNGFFNVQETYDEWRHTDFANGEDKSKRRRCQDCHMPLVASTDPAARDGKTHSHRFIGANTLRPHLDGDTEQLALVQAFLKSGAVKLDLRVEGGKVLARVSNDGVGHRFPTGTVDMHEIWVELVATDARGRVLMTSGAIDPKTNEVDPAAVLFRSVALDKKGEWLYRRDMWNLASFKITPEGETLVPGEFGFVTFGMRRDFFNVTSRRFMKTVWPGVPEDVPFDVKVPADAARPIAVKARLRYRKANQKFTNWVFDPRPLREGSAYVGPHRPGEAMPVTDMAEATLTLPETSK